MALSTSPRRPLKPCLAANMPSLDMIGGIGALPTRLRLTLDFLRGSPGIFSVFHPVGVPGFMVRPSEYGRMLVPGRMVSSRIQGGRYHEITCLLQLGQSTPLLVSLPHATNDGAIHSWMGSLSIVSGSSYAGMRVCKPLDW